MPGTGSAISRWVSFTILLGSPAMIACYTHPVTRWIDRNHGKQSRETMATDRQRSDAASARKQKTSDTQLQCETNARTR